MCFTIMVSFSNCSFFFIIFEWHQNSMSYTTMLLFSNLSFFLDYFWIYIIIICHILLWYNLVIAHMFHIIFEWLRNYMVIYYYDIIQQLFIFSRLFLNEIRIVCHILLRYHSVIAHLFIIISKWYYNIMSYTTIISFSNCLFFPNYSWMIQK